MGISISFLFFINFSCYSMGIMHFSTFLYIFHVIQWEVCNLSILHVIQWKFEAWEALGGTYGRMEIHPRVLQDIGPLGPLPQQHDNKERNKGQTQTKWTTILLIQMARNICYLEIFHGLYSSLPEPYQQNPLVHPFCSVWLLRRPCTQFQGDAIILRKSAIR